MLERFYKYTRKTEELEKAIQITRQMIGAILSEHPSRWYMKSNLSSQLELQHERTSKIEDLKEALYEPR